MTNFENASYSSFFPYRRELHLNLDLADIGLAQQCPMTPEEDDAAAVNALVLLLLTEQEKLQAEECAIGTNVSRAL